MQGKESFGRSNESNEVLEIKKRVVDAFPEMWEAFITKSGFPDTQEVKEKTLENIFRFMSLESYDPGLIPLEKKVSEGILSAFKFMYSELRRKKDVSQDLNRIEESKMILDDFPKKRSDIENEFGPVDSFKDTLAGILHRRVFPNIAREELFFKEGMLRDKP